MLYLTRKVGESVVINDDIEVTVVEVRGRSIKLGFTFPSDVSVLRREIFDRIQEENRAAAGSASPETVMSGPLGTKLSAPAAAARVAAEKSGSGGGPTVVRKPRRAPKSGD